MGLSYVAIPVKNLCQRRSPSTEKFRLDNHVEIRCNQCLQEQYRASVFLLLCLERKVVGSLRTNDAIALVDDTRAGRRISILGPFRREHCDG